MGDISLIMEIMEILRDKYLFSNLPTKLSDFDEQTLINIYLRLIVIYDDANDFSQADFNSAAPQDSKQQALKHISRCIRAFECSFLAPKAICLLDKKKALRIFSELHSEVVKKHGKALSQRIRMVIKREEIRNKNLLRKTENKNTAKFFSYEENINQMTTTSTTPAKLPFSNCIIPGRQIPRTPLKLEKDIGSKQEEKLMPPPSEIERQIPRTPVKLEKDIEINHEQKLMPPPLDFGNNDLEDALTCLSPPPDFNDNSLPCNQTLIICSPPEAFKNMSELDDKFDQLVINNNKLEYCLETELNNVNFFDTNDLHACKEENMENSSIQSVSDQINCSLSPFNQSELSCITSNIDSKLRLSDVAPLKFMDNISLTASKCKDSISRKTYVVPQQPKINETYLVPQPFKSRETYVVPQSLRSRETNVVPQPHKSRETYVVPQPLRSRETYVVPQTLKSRETYGIPHPLNNEENNSDMITEKFTGMPKTLSDNKLTEIINPLDTNKRHKETLHHSFDSKSRTSPIIQETFEKDVETLIKKTKISPDVEATIVTEINYAGKKAIRHFPKGKELLRTPPAGDVSFSNKSANLDSSFNLSKNDLLIQIYLSKNDVSQSNMKTKLLHSKIPEKSSKSETRKIFSVRSDMDIEAIDAAVGSNTSTQYDDSLSIFPSRMDKDNDVDGMIDNKMNVNEDQNFKNVSDLGIEKIVNKENSPTESEDTLKVSTSKMTRNTKMKIEKYENKITETREVQKSETTDHDCVINKELPTDTNTDIPMDKPSNSLSKRPYLKKKTLKGKKKVISEVIVQPKPETEPSDEKGTIAENNLVLKHSEKKPKSISDSENQINLKNKIPCEIMDSDIDSNIPANRIVVKQVLNSEQVNDKCKKASTNVVSSEKEINSKVKSLKAKFEAMEIDELSSRTNSRHLKKTKVNQNIKKNIDTELPEKLPKIQGQKLKKNEKKGHNAERNSTVDVVSANDDNKTKSKVGKNSRGKKNKDQIEGNSVSSAEKTDNESNNLPIEVLVQEKVPVIELKEECLNAEEISKASAISCSKATCQPNYKVNKTSLKCKGTKNDQESDDKSVSGPLNNNTKSLKKDLSETFVFHENEAKNIIKDKVAVAENKSLDSAVSSETSADNKPKRKVGKSLNKVKKDKEEINESKDKNIIKDKVAVAENKSLDSAVSSEPSVDNKPKRKVGKSLKSKVKKDKEEINESEDKENVTNIYSVPKQNVESLSDIVNTVSDYSIDEGILIKNKKIGQKKGKLLVASDVHRKNFLFKENKAGNNNQDIPEEKSCKPDKLKNKTNASSNKVMDKCEQMGAEDEAVHVKNIAEAYNINLEKQISLKSSKAKTSKRNKELIENDISENKINENDPKSKNNLNESENSYDKSDNARVPLQVMNSRPSRRCKTKASEAISQAMNDSLI